MEIRLSDEVCVELIVPSGFLNMNLETPFPPPSLCHSGLWHTPGTADQTELEFSSIRHRLMGFQEAQIVNNAPAMTETWVRSLWWEDALEEGMATHSSILAWRTPMDRGAWRAPVHGVTKSRTRQQYTRLNMAITLQYFNETV